MDLELKDKVAFVTGGSRGIGRLCALRLAQEGAKVCISYASNEDAAKETVDAIVSKGGSATAFAFDVANSDRSKEAIDRIVAEHGGLHILVANAGIAIDGLLMRQKDEDLERIFRTNVFGAFFCARAAIRPMMKARWGRLIFMGSVVGETGNVGQAAYSASKAALDGVAKSLAKELASRNVTSNVIAPGYIETDMTKGMNEEMRAKLIENIPLGRVGSAKDIADAVCFLASERASYITGQILNVNGGLYM